MAPRSNEGRISTLEANMLNVSNIVLDIKKAQIESSAKREEQYIMLITKLTEIKVEQKSFSEYQEKCESDRESMKKDIEAVTQTQQVQKRVGGIFGVLFTGALGILEYLKH